LFNRRVNHRFVFDAAFVVSQARVVRQVFPFGSHHQPLEDRVAVAADDDVSSSAKISWY
jgi:hypothetical protein